MIKLIRLEWKKNNIGKYICKAVVLAVLMGVFIFSLAFLGIANDPDGTLDAADGMNVISVAIELFTNMAFLIFTSVMLASFIVSSYQNKTMDLMFSYPIKRQKILASQMLAVWIFSFVSLVAIKLLLYTFVYMGAQRMPSSFVIDFTMGDPSFYIQILAKSGVIVSMSFIALFVGLLMKSSKATIITSFLLVFLTQANVGDFTLANNAVFPAILTILSLVLAVLSISNAEKKDLM